jgi:hypothetical protein
MSPPSRKRVSLRLSALGKRFKYRLRMRRDGRPGDLSVGSHGRFLRSPQALLELVGAGVGYLLRAPETLRYFARGYSYGLQVPPPSRKDNGAVPAIAPSPLEEWFDAHTGGLGTYKRRHYFDIYHRHLQRFRGQRLHILEIGVAGGGSLEMWRDYFGPDAYVTGIDVNPSCKGLESERIQILIGDQADPGFWAEVLRRSAPIDVVIDDGGHLPRQQTVALECVLPHIRPGGVYLCEDIGGPFQPFHSFIDGLTRPLSTIHMPSSPTPASPLHQHVASVHNYPMVTVIEKPLAIPTAFVAESRGVVRAPRRPTED